nr:DUF2339 domain-containing protein [uncultured Holophaga sp.]
MDGSQEELQRRVAELEARVAWLMARAEAPPAPLPRVHPAPQPSPTQVSPPKARVPRFSPVVLIAAIGAVIFLLGALFFLHLAIQRGWIGAELRLVMGLLVGCTLGGAAGLMILRRSPQLGSCLLLAGLGTLVFTLRWGAFNLHLVPTWLGFGGSVLAALYAGGLASRTRFSPPLWIGLLVGFLAPLLFSQGGHHEVGLAIYLVALMAVALAVPYLARIGARWATVRWLAVLGTWLLLALACSGVPRAEAGVLLGLLILHLLLAGFWIWLPGQGEARPGSPTLLWFLVNLAFSSLAWGLWLRMGLSGELFCGPVLGVAALNLALVRPVRVRLGGHGGDLGLLVLAAGHLAVAVPIVLAWRWVGLFWGGFALALSLAVEACTRHEGWAEERRPLQILAGGMALLATLTWGVHTAQLARVSQLTPFANRAFAEAVLVGSAWGLLTRRRGFLGVSGVILAELIGNIALALELSRAIRTAGGSALAASIGMTLVWAASGALQWLLGLSGEGATRRVFAVSGYVWLGIAGLKLILVDMAEVGAILRALVFLGVGVIFLAAALTGNRLRAGRKDGV